MKKIIFFFLFAVNLLFAQDYGNDSEALKLCSVLQTNQFGTDVEAENALDKILNAIGASKRFVLQPCNNINNAVATSYKGIRYILYDRDFMNSVNYGNNWGNLFVLAHEVGHHINGHSLDLVLYAADAVGQQTLAQSRQDELEADEFAGFILAKLGGPLSAANKVISSFSSNRDDTYSTHPRTSKRLAAAKRGFTKFSGVQNNNNSNVNSSNNSFDVIYYSNGRWEGPVKTTKQNVVKNGVLGTQTSKRPFGKGVFIYNNGEIYEGYFKDELISVKPLAEENFYKAWEKRNEGKHSEAIELFNSAIDGGFRALDAYKLRANSKRELGDNEGAIRDYNIVILKEPNAFNFANRGVTKYRYKDHRGASQDLTKAIELDPTLGWAFYYRALNKFFGCERLEGYATCENPSFDGQGSTPSACADARRAQDLGQNATKFINNFCSNW
jgi:tetratricopeptide (TPR) repeat protein